MNIPSGRRTTDDGFGLCHAVIVVVIVIVLALLHMHCFLSCWKRSTAQHSAGSDEEPRIQQ
jgi:Tfp pilus assembly protein PilE